MVDCVNLSRIQETSDGDLEFEKELIEMYLEDAREHLDSLRSELEAEDVVAFRRSAHTLKGSSSNIGATLMQERAYQLEILARETDLGNATSYMGQMEAALQQTEAFYRKYLDSLT